jgi:SAM-dependent methyltransferase
VTGETSDYWDGIADQGDGLPDGWRRHCRRAHLELVDRWGPPEGVWLKTDLFEERSASRALLPSLPSARWVGMDLSPAVCRQASERSRCAAVVADVRGLPFPNGAFDGVLSTSTLDHFAALDDLHRALVELRRVLRTGGRLLLTLDNPANPLIRVRNALPPAVAVRTGLAPVQVGQTLAEEPGRAALAAAGFAIDDSLHLLHAPHIVGTRLARFRWWETAALPRADKLERSRVARWTGHYVAFAATAIESTG